MILLALGLNKGTVRGCGASALLCYSTRLVVLTMRSSSLVNFTLSSDDRENTVVFGPSGEPLYFVETATIEFGTAPTRIYRADPKGYESKYLVAIIEFHRYRPATITYMGETRDLRDMYPKKGWPSRSRLMPSPFGKCKWSVSNKRPEVRRNRFLFSLILTRPGGALWPAV